MAPLITIRWLFSHEKKKLCDVYNKYEGVRAAVGSFGLQTWNEADEIFTQSASFFQNIQLDRGDRFRVVEFEGGKSFEETMGWSKNNTVQDAGF
ncbi:unnamed protein product [Sphenostylis stenocarpa]|uniref:Uncharacterized protein n=1 Tax=Sphenostylis stenocarpa TaxID=92480 RepID=A0AA86TL80_9FABA|nr:unnamed protein product [Sphenostylis stenocarpa]